MKNADRGRKAPFGIKINFYKDGEFMKTKQQRSLQASNAAHKALQNRAKKNGEQHKEIYHGSCIIRQEKRQRVFTRAEREKVYDDVIKTFW